MLDPDYAVGEFRLKLLGWSLEHRLLVIREQVREGHDSVGRRLIDVPGYTFRVFVTSCDATPQEIWRDYNRRTDMENCIAELKHDLGADGFCIKQFFATEAAFRAVTSFQSAVRVPTGGSFAGLSRTGYNPHSDPHLRRHPRPSWPSHGAPHVRQLGRADNQNPLAR